MTLFKSILHNIGVAAMGLGLARLGSKIDFQLGIRNFQSPATASSDALLLTTGFLLRVWATFSFYQHRMKVISLAPQNTLITSGPYAF